MGNSGELAPNLFSRVSAHEQHDAIMLAWRLSTGDLSKRAAELRTRHVSAFFEYRLIGHLQLEEEVLFPACRAVLLSPA